MTKLMESNNNSGNNVFSLERYREKGEIQPMRSTEMRQSRGNTWQRIKKVALMGGAAITSLVFLYDQLERWGDKQNRREHVEEVANLGTSAETEKYAEEQREKIFGALSLPKDEWESAAMGIYPKVKAYIPQNAEAPNSEYLAKILALLPEDLRGKFPPDETQITIQGENIVLAVGSDRQLYIGPTIGCYRENIRENLASIVVGAVCEHLSHQSAKIYRIYKWSEDYDTLALEGPINVRNIKAEYRWTQNPGHENRRVEIKIYKENEVGRAWISAEVTCQQKECQLAIKKNLAD